MVRRSATLDKRRLHNCPDCGQSGEMLKFLSHFWKTIGFLFFLLAVYWTPKDVLDWRDAAEPWRRLLAMLDKITLLWAGSIVLLLWLFWSEIRPLIRDRFSINRSMRPFKGMYPAKLVYEYNSITGKPQRIANYGVARFYITHGNISWIFLAFERDTGTENIFVASNDGSPIAYDIVDKGPRSLVIKMKSEIPRSGLTIECEDPRDTRKPRALGQSLLFPLDTPEKKQPKIPSG